MCKTVKIFLTHPSTDASSSSSLPHATKAPHWRFGISTKEKEFPLWDLDLITGLTVFPSWSIFISFKIAL
jgi:hypothetical protein